MYQLNYSVIERETLDLVWALQLFEVYVDSGAPLVVFTDHNPITFLNSRPVPKPPFDVLFFVPAVILS